jgi:hypothetical protein
MVAMNQGRPNRVAIVAFLVAGSAFAYVATENAGRGRGFVLAAEPIVFDADQRPRFSAHQVAATAASTRAGLEKWSATLEGKSIIARFRAGDLEVDVVESADEPTIGRAPQPGFLILLAAGDRTKLKTYQLIVNPALAAEYNHPGAIDLGLPRTAADAMALAWAGEMLHIEFYAEGIPLPHHYRADFQERWRLVAAAMGMPRVQHVTDESTNGGPR